MSLLMSSTVSRRSWRSWLALPVLVLGSALAASAADIRDEAGLFSADAVKQAKSALAKIEGDEKLQITIQSVDNLGGRSIDKALPEYAKQLGIRGLFVLISKKESKIEASASREYAAFFPIDRRRSIENAFVAEFKNRQFDQGLAKGVLAIDSAVTDARRASGGFAVAPKAPAPGVRVNAPAPAPAAGKGKFGMGSVIGIILLVLAVIVIFKLISGLFGGNRNTMYGPGMGGMGPGGRPMGGPGYGPGYGGGYGGGGGGGGFMSSLFGGIGGAMAGNWLYDQFRGNRHQSDPTSYDQGAAPLPPDQPAGSDWTADGGTDFGGGGGGSDWGTGGGGGSDWGGGGGGGSDWGGGTGGGDWGGGGGGDWGGGGGDGGGW